MLAGAVAGCAEHVAMYPVDTIKTRMQALGHPGQQLHRSNLQRALLNAVRRDGVLALYRGVGAVAAGAGPRSRPPLRRLACLLACAITCLRQCATQFGCWWCVLHMVFLAQAK